MPDTAQTEDFSYRFLQDIARDLSQKDLKFPTFIEASLRVRMALSRKDLGTNELAKVVRSEPLLSARVVHWPTVRRSAPTGSRSPTSRVP